MYRWVKYLVAFILPALGFISFSSTGLLAWSPLIYAFVALPVVEYFLGSKVRNLTELEREIAARDRVYDVLLYLMPAVQWSALLVFLDGIDEPALSVWDIAGRTIGMGIMCGVIGVNVAHELGHRNSREERFMAKVLLASTTFLHFYIEHNRGHHRNVGTDDDPASAIRGESIYAFFMRTVPGSFMGAWNIVRKERLRKKLPVWSSGNELLQYLFAELMIMVAIAVVFGWLALILFICVSAIGILLLEVINYIEHYGLRRNRLEGKLFEGFRPVHAWNTDHVLSRLVLFELSRHSDHHQFPEKHYQVLNNENHWPQLPAGYSGMFILALIPPIWFRVMDHRVDRYMAV
ncbi:MAG: hypothetical protein RL220_1081 [Bacteroidota bacterium]|jgi:alkane 1-monooxygenase